MGRKLKFKDVVKKGSQGSNKKSSKGNNKNSKKHNQTRKTYSLYKPNNSFKRKTNNDNDDIPSKKRFSPEDEQIPIKRQEAPAPSSESEEEFVDTDPLKQLRDTFGGNLNAESVVSESSSESEEETEDSKEPGSNIDGMNGYSQEEPASEEENTDEDSDQESDLETPQEEEAIDNSKDPFVKHVSYELHPTLLESLESVPETVEVQTKSWTRLGNLVFQIPKCDIKETNKKTNLDNTTYATPSQVPKKIDSKATPKELFIKSQIAPNIPSANKSLIKQDTILTPLQQELFSIINNYQDLYYPERTFDNAEEIRFVYCLHAINHVLKTRIKVLHHNAKLSKKDDVPEEFRDQGLVRPKVLIVAPFKSSAYKIINTIINIMFKEDKGNVIKKLRFIEDYTGNELYLPKKNPKPEDYEKTFTGNTGDDFKIGLTITKKSLKLYSDFYSSDIIVASPLGLRTIIGAEGEPDRDFDFLTSIELLVLDQTEIFFMQNWDHVLHFFKHMHLKPKDLHGTDVSRVRQWCLNLWAKYYRQTLIFSAITLPEINSIFNKKCANFAGKVKVANVVELGCMSQVFVQLPHVFHKFSANNPGEAVEKRFNFFVQKILPQHKDSSMKQTLIYIPSYFDYVKIRNYFKREDINFVQICEYSKDAKVARARDMFYHGDAQFLIYTERHHFFHRIRVKGIRHLIFYQPPNLPNFYYEVSNLMQEANMNKKVGSMTNMTVTVIYSKYDILQLAAIVGTERAAKMVQSERDVHMMVTGAD
ncbi:unnamed protein product [Ceutorhynchus assimilis]|uniref:Digestive organ expansion factor homolog n=1 Tax=Ceutorhynchus assimilis TaxID=467358 RepID=A0A9N9MIE1_9CUCU|nr:unnamed protein product [Ceutorhynchus assimilis]